MLSDSSRRSHESLQHSGISWGVAVWGVAVQGSGLRMAVEPGTRVSLGS